MTHTIGQIFGLKTPKAHVFKDAMPTGSNPDLLMGLELETEGCDHSSDWYDEYLSRLGVSTTVDNSLRGENLDRRNNVEGFAYEFITKPMAQQSIHALLPKYFEITKFTKDNFSERCSVHVHLNCINLTPEQVSCLALIYTVVEDVLFKFAGEEREHNIFCVPWNQCRLNYNLVETLTQSNEHAVDGIRRWQKYTALNLQPLRDKGTVEFRHLPGTADAARLVTWTNVLGQMHKYASTCVLTELIDEIKGLNSTSEYEKFFGKVIGSYLPYSDEYREMLERGVLCAKFSLTTWKKAKTAAPKRGLLGEMPQIYTDIYNRAIEEGVIEAAAPAGAGGNLWSRAPEAPRVRANPGINRLNPWPPRGTIIRTDLTPWNLNEATTLRQPDALGVIGLHRVAVADNGTQIMSVPVTRTATRNNI